MSLGLFARYRSIQTGDGGVMVGSEPVRTDVNRAVWDGWAAAAGTDAHYDAAALVAGTWRRTDVEQAAVELAVGEVAGRGPKSAARFGFPGWFPQVRTKGL